MPADPSRLSIGVEHADGRVTRWGPDELDTSDIPNDLTFGSSVPGGYRDMSCSLLRRLDRNHPDQDLFDTATVYGPGNRIAWQGRMTQFPRSHGPSFQITPGAVGWSAHLRDDPSYRVLHVDRDMAHWGPPTLTRQANAAGAGTPTGKVQINQAPGGMVMDVPNEAIPNFENFEIFYDAGVGLKVARVDYVGQRTGASWAASWGAPSLVTATDEGITTGVTFQSLTFDAVAHVASSFTANRYALLETQASAAHTPAAGHQQRILILNVIGGSGISLYGAADGLGGVLASDVIAHAITNAAPLLRFSTGADGSINPSEFVIPHVVFRDPVTAEDVISKVNGYHLYDWGVYDNREFFFRPPDPTRLLWRARLGDGAAMNADGLTGEQVINGVLVFYTDATGRQLTVGPTGSNADSTSSALADTDTANPANSHGIVRKLDTLSISYPTTAEGAIQIGTVYLRERALATRRGSLTLTGTVEHPTEGKVPVWRVRAGDWVQVTDLNGENATVQRKIISQTYSHASRSNTLELDNTPAKLSAIMERVGIQTGIMTGGGF